MARSKDSADTMRRAGATTTGETRRRIAAALIKRGSDAGPVQHWTQGAARVAQALMGAAELHKLEREEAQARAQALAAHAPAAAGPPPPEAARQPLPQRLPAVPLPPRRPDAAASAAARMPAAADAPHGLPTTVADAQAGVAVDRDYALPVAYDPANAGRAGDTRGRPYDMRATDMRAIDPLNPRNWSDYDVEGGAGNSIALGTLPPPQAWPEVAANAVPAAPSRYAHGDAGVLGEYFYDEYGRLVRRPA